MARISARTWIFISHASADLVEVRKVRNYLESLDASPLLFHLISLKHEDQFWPIIEQEIEERDFFLLCESKNADLSETVQRERKAVELANEKRPKRIQSIRVDVPEISFQLLDQFVAATRIFPSFIREDEATVQPFLDTFVKRGFEVYGWRESRFTGSIRTELMQEIHSVGDRGWFVIFLTVKSLQSKIVKFELTTAINEGVRIIPVLIEKLDSANPLPTILAEINYFDATINPLPTTLAKINWFDATIDPANAPEQLADELHTRELS